MISREPTIERLATAQGLLLEPFGLNESHLSRALAEITAHKVDDADLYFQYTRSEGWSLEEGIVKTGSFSIDQGVGRREVGSSGGGGRFGLAYFDDAHLNEYVNDAVKAALTNLESRPAPAGEMTVVLGPGWPGILLHEAIGHGLEGDFNRKGSSAFSGRVGKRVAAKGVTVLDDGTIADRRGSLNVDDEGNASQRNVLIEDGILRGYIQDSLNARLMGVQSTGNGRRESYAHIPMPRMTNTYMLGGDKAP